MPEMPVTVQVAGLDAVVLRLQSLPDQVRASLRRAVMAAAIDVQERAREKTAGEVLQERTHHLHDSIHVQVLSDDASGITAAVGTDVVYAAFHEYGFSGTEQVREHLRKISVAFGKPIAPVQATVRAHSRNVNYPPHSFLRSSLAELEPEIRARIEAAVGEAATR